MHHRPPGPSVSALLSGALDHSWRVLRASLRRTGTSSWGRLTLGALVTTTVVALVLAIPVISGVGTRSPAVELDSSGSRSGDSPVVMGLDGQPVTSADFAGVTASATTSAPSSSSTATERAPGASADVPAASSPEHSSSVPDTSGSAPAGAPSAGRPTDGTTTGRATAGDRTADGGARAGRAQAGRAPDGRAAAGSATTGSATTGSATTGSATTNNRTTNDETAAPEGGSADAPSPSAAPRPRTAPAPAATPPPPASDGAPAPPPAAPAEAPAAPLPEVLTLVNAERAAVGCPGLVSGGGLAATARAHSAAMEASGELDDRDGAVVAQRRPNARSAVATWLADPADRAVLLDCDRTAAGVGTVDGWWTIVLG